MRILSKNRFPLFGTRSSPATRLSPWDAKPEGRRRSDPGPAPTLPALTIHNSRTAIVRQEPSMRSTWLFALSAMFAGDVHAAPLTCAGALRLAEQSAPSLQANLCSDSGTHFEGERGPWP